MTRTIIVFFLVVLCVGLYAQWSTDAANPFQIYNGTAAQVMPKTAVTSNEYTWIAWMDNTTGNYNTYLQKLNQQGSAEWLAPLLVSSHPTMTWLTEWDIDSDPNGNAVLVFQDIRQAANNVVAYKISPEGTFLWGNDGIMLSNDTSEENSNMSPTALCLSDGLTIVGWQRFATATTTNLQCLSQAGELLWGTTGITLSLIGGSCTWPQLLEADNANVLVKYYEDTGPGWSPTRHIKVQKYDATGQGVWTNPAIVQNLGGISAWTQWLSIDSNNSGGMIIGWHEDRNSDNISESYVQMINSDGSLAMQANGIQVSTEQGFHQFYPKLAYEPAQQEIYVFWNRLNSNQNMWGLQTQKLSINGERLWSDTGTAIIPLGANPTYPITAGFLNEGVVYVYAYGPQAGNDLIANLYAYCINTSGQPAWANSPLALATTSTQKLHYSCAASQQSFGVVAWEDGGGPSHTYAMRFNANGTLGAAIPAPYNLTAQVVNGNDVLLSWEFPETFMPPIGYKIYRNSIFYVQVDGAATMNHTILNIGPGEWSFYVTAIFESGDDSPASNIVTVSITENQEAQLELLPLSLSISPNPFQWQTTFSVKGARSSSPAQIAIYNAKGQLVRRMGFAGSAEINWRWDGRDMQQANVSPGLYLVRVTSAGQQYMTKLMKY
jgi:hypothetical protein